MATRPERKDARKCCCCIPLRVGVAILAWLYFVGGVLATVAAILVLIKGLTELENATKALVIALAALSVFLTITAGVGIIATVKQSPRFARLFSVLFRVWFFLQLALDIAVVALFFAKQLDSLAYECKGLSGVRSRPGSSAQKNCERTRNRLSLYYTISGVVRNAVGYYFVRRVVSFSRHCAERSASQANNATMTQMISMSKAPFDDSSPPTPSTLIAGAMSTPNFPHAIQPPSYNQTPIPEQMSSSQNLNVQGGYPASYRVYAGSIQGAEQVQEAPTYYNTAAARVV